MSTSIENIDIHSVIMASQAISKEISLDQLLRTLMKIVIVNAGAQRGCILMNTSSTSLVAGGYESEQDEITVRKYDISDFHEYPKAVLQAVAASGETIIYNNAADETPFADDPYIMSRQPQSVLCMPLMNQNKVTAFIYLENNLVTGAFTKERLKMIDLLSREMVYSLENASLYTDLEKSEEKYRDLINYLMDGIAIIQDRRFVFVNEAMGQMLGYAAADMTDMSLERFMTPDDLAMVQSHHDTILANAAPSLEYEVRLGYSDGRKEITAIFKATAIQYLSKPAILVAVKDITERKRSEEELRTHRDKLEQLVAERTEELEHKNAELNRYFDIVDKNVVIVQIDPHGIITLVSEEFCELSGYRREELLGSRHTLMRASSNPGGAHKEFAISSIQGDGWRGELLQRRKDGSILWLDLIMEPVIAGDLVSGYTFIGHNITDKKRIEQLSITDELTSLFNRRYFNELFSRELKRAVRKQSELTLILLDIDYYKKYNDTYGHYEGDRVLRKIGAAIQGQLRKESDFAFRLGGEEFGILSKGRSPKGSYDLAEQIRQSIEALQIPHEKNDRSEYVTVSVGVAVAKMEAGEFTNEAMYKLADSALYASKAKGRNCVTLHILSHGNV
ncbi:sensor domain-containing diguanylate cyclase [Paenibacillus hexagrammi]|uniref:Diguanylate cyclase n=1 Tax=Paenibacillus hexagrammi TaxID=2908839 RepID=A0ABY3SHN7_9BACL|nr:diguanylate cyclase [Paenibacillus sp. YPD9-1]UJF33407.1 diguanylate cyclase [Paenibacillus sp. YPD9-1]